MQVLWYGIKPGQMECVTQEMPILKPICHVCGLLKLQSVCWSINVHVALLTFFFGHLFSWSGKDEELIWYRSKGPNAEMSSLSWMTILHQFGGWNHLVLLHMQSYKLIPVMVTLTLPSVLGFCSTGTVMFPWEKWLVSTIAKACLLQAKAS